MPESTSRPRRRWFQFSLASLFVVTTLFAVWLGWELKFVRDRKAFIRSVERQYGFVKLQSEYPSHRKIIPFWRTWLGDEDVVFIYINNNQPFEVIKTAASLFPGADLETSDHIRITPEVIAYLEQLQTRTKAAKPIDKDN